MTYARCIASCLLPGLLAALLTACSSRPVAPEVSFPPTCTVLPAPTAAAPSGESLRLGVHSHSERSLFAARPDRLSPLLARQLYQTLTVPDCTGITRPSAARRWRHDRAAGRWTFHLDPEARFWDGTRVTASRVASGWADIEAVGLDSVTVGGPSTLHIYTADPALDLPRLLADLRFAVMVPGPNGPQGTGPYRLDRAGGAVPRVEAASGWPPIELIRLPGPDARDALGAGVDVLLSRDPSTIAYAEAQPAFSTRTLPWDRTYALLLPSIPRTPDLPAALRTGLARDAVRAEARAANVGAFTPSPGCVRITYSLSERIAPDPEPTRTLWYEADDPAARSLAERIVALATADTAAFTEAALLAGALPELTRPDAAPPTATGLPRAAFQQRLSAGDGAAYLVALPHHGACPLPPLPWLPAGTPLAQVLVPLVETRPTLIARTDRAGWIVDGMGHLLLVPSPPSR